MNAAAASKGTEAMNVLIVGAREKSIGWHVADALFDLGISTTTIGESDDEEVKLDIWDYHALQDALVAEQFTDVVCTVGVNYENAMSRLSVGAFREELFVNTVLPIALLQRWLAATVFDWGARGGPGHYVALSSNSAHIARSQSLGYCASKAALSMALRCAARDLAGEPVVIYGYEPGWVEGTPMSDAVTGRLANELPPHRIPGGRGVKAANLANLIVNNLVYGGHELNGTTIRVDGGEQ